MTRLIGTNELAAQIMCFLAIRRWRFPLATLALLAATHFVVDTVATTVNPLWPALEQNLGLSTGGLLWVYVIWLISTSFTQLLFGYFGDRFGGRWLIWAGPMAAIICLSGIGLASSPMLLAGLLVVSGLGIAAFHPEAAASAGALLPEHRSRVMAIFCTQRLFGAIFGPLLRGTADGSVSLAWFDVDRRLGFARDAAADLGVIAKPGNERRCNSFGRIADEFVHFGLIRSTNENVVAAACDRGLANSACFGRASGAGLHSWSERKHERRNWLGSIHLHGGHRRRRDVLRSLRAATL